MRDARGRDQGARGRARARSRPSATSSPRRSPTSRTPTPPTATPRRTRSSCARSASGPSFDFEVRDHLELGLEHGLDRDGEGGARRRARGSPTCSATWCMVELALIRFAVETGARRGLRAGRAAGARPRGAAVRDRLLPRRARDDLRGPSATSSSWSAPRRSRSPRCTPTRSSTPASCRAATRASRPASGARPAPPARTPAGSSASTSSTRSRCSRSSSPTSRAPSTSGCWRSRSGSCGALEIPYRVVDIAVGDLGAPAARKFDCEAWIPSQERYRELTSCSNTTDYQARRLGRRYRPEAEAPPAGRAHAERHRGRRRPDADRADRERPAGRRLGRACRRPWSTPAPRRRSAERRRGNAESRRRPASRV